MERSILSFDLDDEIRHKMLRSTTGTVDVVHNN